jgi:hypothetical protein
MKRSIALQLAYALLAAVCPTLALADTVVLSNGGTVDGIVVRTNGEELLVVTDYTAFNFWRGSVKEIKTDPAGARELSRADRLPSFKLALRTLAAQAWAPDLKPIPATVIDKGKLRNVPYLSFLGGDDYEVNIYGDPEHPAGFEVGVCRKLLEDPSAKTNCINLAAQLLGKPEDKEVIRGLNTEKDLKTSDGLTFEITPPSAEDAYRGWWVSVYSERALDAARASEEEMKQISLPENEAERQARTGDPTSWSAQDLKLAREGAPTTITFMTKSGSVIRNALVVRTNEGVSLVWRDGASGGVVKLADLPEDLRAEFGYDPEKTRAADAAETARKERDRQQAQALASTVTQPVASASTNSVPSSTSPSSPPPSYGSRPPPRNRRVYVHSYARKNGSYVPGHSRGAPRVQQ